MLATRVVKDQCERRTYTSTETLDGATFETALMLAPVVHTRARFNCQGSAMLIAMWRTDIVDSIVNRMEIHGSISTSGSCMTCMQRSLVGLDPLLPPPCSHPMSGAYR